MKHNVKVIKVARNAVNGRFVRMSYAKMHPKTTVVEVIRKVR